MSSCIGETSLSHSEAGNKGTRELKLEITWQCAKRIKRHELPAV